MTMITYLPTTQHQGASIFFCGANEKRHAGGGGTPMGGELSFAPPYMVQYNGGCVILCRLSTGFVRDYVLKVLNIKNIRN